MKLIAILSIVSFQLLAVETDLNALLFKYKNNEKMIRHLVAQGADINAKDSEGRTLLHLASGELVPTLLELKANIEALDRYQETPLFAQLGHHDLKAVELLLSNGANVHAKDTRGDTPIFGLYLFDSEASNLEALTSTLVKYGADPKFRNRDMDLYRASCVNGIENLMNAYLIIEKLGLSIEWEKMENCIHSLLNKKMYKEIFFLQGKGLNLNYTYPEHNETFFEMTITHGKIDLAKIFIEQGNKPQMNTEKFPEVVQNVIFGNFSSVKSNLDSGVSIDMRDWLYDYTLLMWASIFNRLDILDLLLQRGANPLTKAQVGPDAYTNAVLLSGHHKNSEAFNLLIQKSPAYFKEKAASFATNAINNDDEKLAINILSQTKDIYQSHLEGCTARRMIACGDLLLSRGMVPKKNAFSEVIDENFPLDKIENFLKSGADPNQLYVSTVGANYQKGLLKLLWKYGANWKKEDFSNMLIEAHHSGRSIDLREFLDFGADVNHRNKEGKSAVYYGENEQDVRNLIQAGANVDLPDLEGESPIFDLLFYTPNRLDNLLKNGANINFQNKVGKTPLMVSLSNTWGNFKVVEKLLDLKANTKLKDNLGKTALDYALEFHPENIYLIEKLKNSKD